MTERTNIITILGLILLAAGCLFVQESTGAATCIGALAGALSASTRKESSNEKNVASLPDHNGV